MSYIDKATGNEYLKHHINCHNITIDTNRTYRLDKYHNTNVIIEL